MSRVVLSIISIPAIGLFFAPNRDFREFLMVTWLPTGLQSFPTSLPTATIPNIQRKKLVPSVEIGEIKMDGTGFSDQTLNETSWGQENLLTDDEFSG